MNSETIFAEQGRSGGLAERLRARWHGWLGSRDDDAVLAVSDRSAANPALLALAFMAALGAIAVMTGIQDGGRTMLAFLLLVSLAVVCEVACQLVERRWPRVLWLVQVKVGLYAFAVGAALWVCLASPEPLAYTRHPIVFLVYLLLITTAGLRDEPRLPLTAGLCSLVSYALVVAMAPRVVAVSGSVKATALMRDFDFSSAAAHGVMLFCITLMAVSAARRGQAIRRLSVRDGLTGLLNRQVLDACLANEAERAKRSGLPLSIAMVDVDFFKSLNDTHGHAFGDDVLRWIAGVLRQSFRTTDLVARYGGEEFVVILVDSAGDRLVRRLDAMREQIARARFRPAPGTDPVQVTVSVGVASWPADAPDARAALALADERLYRAKGAGRNQVVAAAAG